MALSRGCAFFRLVSPSPVLTLPDWSASVEPFVGGVFDFSEGFFFAMGELSNQRNK
jgi:hypothetical protein